MTVNIYQIETINYLWPVRQDFVTTVTNWHSFDAWGNRRDPLTWQAATVTLPDLFCDRGFTGHEHLAEFGLINMNGRVYDPFLCRMLSPDNYVQAPDFTQNLNRYSYCVNNPLKYNDPSGHIIGFISGFIINGFLGGITNGIFTGIDEQKRGNDFSYGFLKGFGTGFLSAGITGGLKSGMEAYLNGANFWTGKVTLAMRNYIPSFKGNETGVTNSEDCFRYQVEHFKNSEYYTNNVSIGVENCSLPKGYYMNDKNQIIEKSTGNYIAGLTQNGPRGMKADIWISGDCIKYDGDLIPVLGHETIHAYHGWMFGMSTFGEATSEFFANRFSALILPNNATNDWTNIALDNINNYIGNFGNKIIYSPVPGQTYPTWVPQRISQGW